MKKAFLVKASVMTRIVIDVPEHYNITDLDSGKLFDNVCKIAKPRLQANITGDSIEEIEEDIEVPYDPKTDTEWN